MNDNSQFYSGLTDPDIRKRAAINAANKRAEYIRTLPDAELEGYCTPAELVGVRGTRGHFARFNQPELEFWATFDKDAARELKVRNGELPR